jgi:hypothetical protein
MEGAFHTLPDYRQEALRGPTSQDLKGSCVLSA